jgi:hypothetical protein
VPILPGVKYDYFLSYAHGGDDLLAWSKRVENKLSGALQLMFGDRDKQLSVFRDYDALQGNGFLTPQLKGGAESSAAIVVILTHLYQKSPWCQKEAAWFAAAAGNAERIFVICAQNLPEDAWPAALRQNGERMVGYRFCDEGDDALPYGLLGQQDQLDASIAGLSKALFKYLRTRQKPSLPAPAPGSDRPRLFVGFTTEDIEEERADLAKRLSADGAFSIVAPEVPDDLEQIHDVAAAAAEDCAALVQICGRASGRWKRSADGFIAGQIRLFEARRRPSWLTLAPNLDPARLASSPYADFLAARMDRMRPGPAVADLQGMLTAIPAKAAAGACTIFIQSRQTYADLEKQLRQKLLDASKGSPIRTRVLPAPPIYLATNPQQIDSLLDQRSQRAKDIQAELLFLTEDRTLLGEDLDEYWRDSSGGIVTWPAAIVDTTSGPAVTEADIGHPVFRLDDPSFGTVLTAWLHQRASEKVGS